MTIENQITAYDQNSTYVATFKDVFQIKNDLYGPRYISAYNSVTFNNMYNFYINPATFTYPPQVAYTIFNMPQIEWYFNRFNSQLFNEGVIPVSPGISKHGNDYYGFLSRINILSDGRIHIHIRIAENYVIRFFDFQNSYTWSNLNTGYLSFVIR